MSLAPVRCSRGACAHALPPVDRHGNHLPKMSGCDVCYCADDYEDKPRQAERTHIPLRIREQGIRVGAGRAVDADYFAWQRSSS